MLRRTKGVYLNGVRLDFLRPGKPRMTPLSRTPSREPFVSIALLGRPLDCFRLGLSFRLSPSLHLKLGLANLRDDFRIARFDH